MIQIKSKQNYLVKLIKKLQLKKYRDQFKYFIIENEYLIEEAMKKNVIFKIISCDKNYHGIFVSENIIKYLSNFKNPSKRIAVCYQNIFKDQILGKKVLMLNNVQDAGNIGTLIRTAVAFNYSDIIVQGVDIFNWKIIHATQGSFFKINIIKANDINFYLKNDYLKIGAVINNQAKKYHQIDYKFNQGIILILGNEGHGIDKKIYQFIDHFVYIPINFESLNVAIAGGILMNFYQKYFSF